jgi:large subunit ribosomal protein L22
MEAQARAKNVRRAPRKARQVAALVRGMRVEEALTRLRFTPAHAAVDVAKTIKSAAANAEHNFDMSPDELFVKSIVVDEGARAWRARFVSRGRMDRYAHRFSHITVVVEDRPDQVAGPRRRVSRQPQPVAEEFEPESEPAEKSPPEAVKEEEAVDEAAEGVE